MTVMMQWENEEWIFARFSQLFKAISILDQEYMTARIKNIIVEGELVSRQYFFIITILGEFIGCMKVAFVKISY